MRITREEKAVRDAAKEEERARKAFEASPAGRARAAAERGDGYFEIELDLRGGEDGDALSRVEAEGWRFLQASHVFVQTGGDSREKFLVPGQRTSVSGLIVGIYLFRRSPEGVAEAGAE